MWLVAPHDDQPCGVLIVETSQSVLVERLTPDAGQAAADDEDDEDDGDAIPRLCYLLLETGRYRLIQLPVHARVHGCNDRACLYSYTITA